MYPVSDIRESPDDFARDSEAEIGVMPGANDTDIFSCRDRCLVTNPLNLDGTVGLRRDICLGFTSCQQQGGSERR